MNFRLDRIEINNIKGLEHFRAELNGNNAYILAGNGQGKSTILQVVEAILYEKRLNAIPQPIRQGISEAQGGAEISFRDEQGQEWLASVSFKETKDGRILRTIKIDTPMGVVLNNKKQIQELFGHPPCIDVKEFILQQNTAPGRRKNISTLLLPLIKEDLDPYYETIKGLRKEAADKRKLYKAKSQAFESLNLDIDYVMGLEEGNTHDIEDLKEQRDIALRFKDIWDRKAGLIEQGVTKETQEAFDANKRLEKAVEELDAQIDEEIAIKMREIKALEKIKKNPGEHSQIKSLKEDLDRKKEVVRQKAEAIQKAEAYIAENPSAPDIDEVDKLIEDAIRQNQAIEQALQLKPDAIAIDQLMGEEQKINKKVEQEIERVKKVIGEAGIEAVFPEYLNLKIDGDFPELQYVNDQGHVLPLVESQIETSIMYVIVLDLLFNVTKMSKVRILLVKDASLFDDERITYILDRAKKENFQLLLEKVSNDQEIKIEIKD